jgi:glycosyltransferase involved in cell wall biosynthesis
MSNKLNRKKGWLVNDCLTCIPGVRTFWHDLLDWFPGLEDKCNGYTDYSVLAEKIESILDVPDYIIRNGSYFRKLNIDVPTFCLVQDTMDTPMQTEVLNTVTCVVFASKQTHNLYKDRITPNNVRVIEQSSDFNFFKPIEERHPDILPNSILFIGDSSHEKKGFHRVQKLIDTMKDFNFCLVMKDDTTLESISQESRNRVRIFNKVDRETVRLLINSSVCAICTSGNEEGHFAGIEIGACNIPMVARPMGCYLDRKDDKTWGVISKDEDFPESIRHVVNNLNTFSPRDYYSKEYTLERCREKWTDLLEEFV